MALLNIYKNPKANILYGEGNNKISDADIKAFISAPGRTAAEIQGAALTHGVNTDQIARAMNGNPTYGHNNIDKYLAEQGVTKDLAEKPLAEIPQVSQAERVSFKPIEVGANETVQGRMDGLLKDHNNPLNVQAQTFGNQQANRRGLLNSSIAVSGAQDAMYKMAMPIATQDAGTIYDAKKTNAIQGMNSDMFNSEASLKTGMFNAGTAKDMTMSRESNTLNKYIADMDSGNKLAIANIQAMANDSGIMGDLGKNFMSLYQQTASDPNITPEVKAQMFGQLKSQFESISSLLPSFERAGKKMVFSTASGPSASVATALDVAGGIGGSGVTSRKDGAVTVTGIDGKTGSFGSIVPDPAGGYTLYAASGLRIVPLSTKDYKFGAQELTGIRASMAAMGRTDIDINDIAPQELIDEINRMQGGQTAMPDPRFFVSVPIPGSRRADNLAFSIYKSAAPKYQ